MSDNNEAGVLAYLKQVGGAVTVGQVGIHFKETTAWASKKLLNLLGEEKVKRLPNGHYTYKPQAATRAAKAHRPYLLDVKGGEIIVRSDYHPEIPKPARNRGGAYIDDAWHFPLENKKQVRELFDKVFGSLESPLVDVVINLAGLSNECPEKPDFYLLARKIAYTTTKKKYVATLGEGVIVRSGEGFKVVEGNVVPSDDTEIIVRRVSTDLFDRFNIQYPGLACIDGTQTPTLIKNDHVREVNIAEIRQVLNLEPTTPIDQDKALLDEMLVVRQRVASCLDDVDAVISKMRKKLSN